MKKYLFSIAILLGVVSCTQDFENINTNPNEPITVSGDLLLRSAIFDLSNLLVSETYGFTDIVAQYTANYEFNQLDIYNWTSDSRFWYLYDYLQDVKDVKRYGSENELPNYEAVALILEAFSYSILTDAYGDVPFSESNQAEVGVLSPVYDTQASIYGNILAQLEQANQLIDESSSIEGDLLYGGDMHKWRKFANSLRVRLLMRTSNVQNVSAALQAIVDNPAQYPVFESIDDNAVYYYSGVTPDISPYSSGLGREYEYYLGIPSTHFVNLLLENSDPRIEEWLDEHEKEDGILEYIGTAPGQDQGDIGRPGDFASKDASYFYDPAKISAIFMPFSELNFLFAEAAHRNIIGGEAADWYEAGVQAAFEEWGVTMPDEFLSVAVPFDENNLFEQKWLALYHCGMEAWFDWKRTGKPDFIQAGPGNVNNGQVPVRLMYPSLEQSVNATNYQAASQRIGGDNINTRVWWDK
ncbi:MAG TPA: SusD/RagB family nutrient-binding outer membrane lipoprotein [Saprospiraceae bacterium]|nr:SusD/RagB family nutrient-binding outer membrane lipoprotein [Saprospiraceae bacterium]HMQ85728.1 SusD/RagB family nutrient-binding outer membrane lipoprotein [Saprospiraceae bacterium]